MGQLTKERQQLVKNAYLVQIANRLELDHYLIKRVTVEFGGDSISRVLSNCVEAIIGAVFLDGGLEEADKVFARMAFPGEVSCGEREGGREGGRRWEKGNPLANVKTLAAKW